MKEIMPKDGQFAMPALPYEELGKVISKETLSFHHGKHLKAYVDNLNKMLPGSGLEGKSLSEVVCKAEGGLFNNAGQVLNHTMYFEQFSNTPREMSTKFAAMIEKDFGSVVARTGNLFCPHPTTPRRNMKRPLVCSLQRPHLLSGTRRHSCCHRCRWQGCIAILPRTIG